ncbi:uncharacterized protein LOC111389370 [Olea europaea var. sylvestris]|uniref:uncharacterized protein LOC111389370 n=1 Tax=Olea europaea var. sylvestris TaxID=158386 RepID=UPI000C1D54DB|nr:uncharacterized protein LOC111389370 [Olea europaea var. sylvestris]
MYGINVARRYDILLSLRERNLPVQWSFPIASILYIIYAKYLPKRDDINSNSSFLTPYGRKEAKENPSQIQSATTIPFLCLRALLSSVLLLSLNIYRTSEKNYILLYLYFYFSTGRKKCKEFRSLEIQKLGSFGVVMVGVFQFLLVTLGSNYSVSYLIVLMDVSETCSNGVIGSLNFETMSHRQQQNQRQKDRRNRFRIGCNDHRKRINDPMSSEINNSNIERIQQSIMHHDFEASTSNQETHDISNSALRSSFNVLNIPMTSYILPTCSSCKNCGARKFYRESKGFVALMEKFISVFLIHQLNCTTCLLPKNLNVWNLKRLQGDIIIILLSLHLVLNTTKSSSNQIEVFIHLGFKDKYIIT